jgi:nucleotide-binding universal stress UspA family protein
MLRWSTRPILAADVDPSRPVDFRPSCILAPVEDSSASLRAARLAAAIAKAYATRLVLVRPGGVPSLGASMWSRAIERAVVEHRPSLIVMGVARSRGLRSLFSSSVVERVLQEAQAPLLVVHE